MRDNSRDDENAAGAGPDPNNIGFSPSKVRLLIPTLYTADADLISLRSLTM